MASIATIHIDNPQFIKKNNDRYDCFIVLGKNYLNYVLMNEDHSVVFSIKHFDFKNQVIGKSDFDEILADRILQKSSKFYVAIDSLKTTLVPNEFYRTSTIELYTKHLFELAQEEELHEMKIGSQLTSIYALKKESTQYLKNRLRQVEFSDPSSCLLSSYPKQIHSDDEHSIFINAKPDSAVFTIYKGKELLLHKVVSYFSINELVFHVVNSATQYNMKATTIGINVHGESNQCSLLYDELKNHYTTRYCSRLHEFAYPEELYNYPSHYFFNLFSFALCVS